jgi:hypothetical protein
MIKILLLLKKFHYCVSIYLLFLMHYLKLGKTHRKGRQITTFYLSNDNFVVLTFSHVLEVLSSYNGLAMKWMDQRM